MQILKVYLVAENNGKQNPKESYTNKYQKHIACSYGYKLLCVDDKFSKTSHFHNAVHNFINSMIKGSKCCITFFIRLPNMFSVLN